VEKLFVYGTLKRGFGNNVYHLSDAHYLGAAETGRKYKMLDLGGFPGVVDGADYIKGELYVVDSLSSIDTLEGYPNFYGREKTTIWTDTTKGPETHDAWIYKLVDKNGWFHLRDSCPVVESGEWVKR